MWSVKVVFSSNDLRRFALSESPTHFDHLQSLVAAHLPREQRVFSLKFRDDEGELCTIASEQELSEAFEICGVQKALKIHVFCDSVVKESDDRVLDTIPATGVSGPFPELKDTPAPITSDQPAFVESHTQQIGPSSASTEAAPQQANLSHPSALQLNESPANCAVPKTALKDVPSQLADAFRGFIGSSPKPAATTASSSSASTSSGLLSSLQRLFSREQPAPQALEENHATRKLSAEISQMNSDFALVNSLRNALPLVAMGPLRHVDSKDVASFTSVFALFLLQASTPHVTDEQHKFVLDALIEDLNARPNLESYRRTLNAFRKDVGKIVRNKQKERKKAQQIERRERASDDAKFAEDTHAALTASVDVDSLIPSHFTGATREKLRQLYLMGFKNFELNAFLLQEHKANLQAVVDWLLARNE